MTTIFTKIINREIPSDIIYEDEYVVGFKDINPQAPVHILIVPKKEISTVNDITDEDCELIGKMYLAIGNIAKKIGIAEEGYRVITNCNSFGGQEVYHLHFHLLGGKQLGHLV
ncbi:histidine triad nucleotide-binding protein [Fusobacterium sp. PH5-44]|uniref:histidine triad nucleotide-binding protein n=1 Tax=unclassified Fusobacterium TaxID=2648384 RepID=UPI003D1DD219